ncbi:MAG: glycosyltransferase family 2 protein [Candidatus Omnitrophota bacterium]|nr:glycosyltransferase family 2 protein [Candidatus Omnitrophota bacterium]
MVAYSIVVPVFNEARNIRCLYERLTATMKRLGVVYELIFVNDGSSDDSFTILRDIALSNPTVKVINFDRNYGQHKAVVAGILQACGDYVITIDADLQNPPEEIGKLLQKMREGFDMVSGYRRIRKDRLARRFPAILTNWIISLITGLRMKDYGSMLRVFKREAARALATEFLKSGGYITMLVAKVTRNVAEVEVRHDGRYAGRSKYNMRKLFMCLYRILFYYNDNIRALVKRAPDKPSFMIEKKVGNEKEITIAA